MAKLTKKEMRRLVDERNKEKAREALREHELSEQRFKQEKHRKKRKKIKIITIVLVCILVLAALITYARLSPGKYDDFAKCLTERGVMMYGEDWCKYTNAQKGMFGKSFKYINYQVKQNLRVRPTWMVNGTAYETVQSFQKLSELTGCRY